MDEVIKVEAVKAEIDASAALSPRKTRKLSDPKELNNQENAPAGKLPIKAPAAAASKARSITRFGFKKRSFGEVAVEAKATGAAASSGSTFQAQARPVDLLTTCAETIGDLDAAQVVLKLRTSGNNNYQFKDKIAEQSEIIKQLKGTLAEQIKRGRRICPDVLAPLQEEINGRLRALAEEAASQRTVAQRATDELSGVRKRADEHGKKVLELRQAGEAREKELTAHEERADAEGRRADRAEGSLKTRDKELAEATAELASLKEASSEAALSAAAAAEAASAAGEKAAAELEAYKAEAQATIAELTASRDAEAKRANEAEKSLASTTAERDTLKESLSALTREHSGLGESAAATKARLESITAQLEEKTKAAEQKDTDLRESIQTVTQMQKDHQGVISHERQRAQALEDEARGLRDRIHEAETGKKDSDSEITKLKAELEASKHELSTSQASLSHSTSERERLAIETAEQKEAITKGKQDNEALECRFKESTEQLASVSATLTAKTAEAEKLASEKHEVEVEYRSYQEHHGTSNQQQMAAISELKLTVDRLNQSVETKSSEANVAQGSLAQQAAYLAEMESKLNQQESLRRALHNQIQELKGNIRVFCRVRPSNAAADGAEPNRSIECSQDTKLALTHKEDTHQFAFDKVFNGSAGQEDVFTEVDGLVQSALDGYKVCIFAYGQTGSGKTYTMQGGTDPASWGLIPRALSKILNLSEAMRVDGWSWTLTASFCEIYNESLRDLLHTGKEAPPSYAIKHDEAWGTVVANMGRVEVSSMDEINSLMTKAAKQRAVGCTDMNSQSSRSHSIFALYLKGTNTKLNTELHGALHLVDLAGSERLSKSGAEGVALKETQAINKSLSSLADVFSAKAAGNSHVPFRNSKLTHLMEPCLSGQGKTLMLVNVAPETDNSHETLCSLRFAKQVNQCDTGGAQKGAPKRSAKAPAPAAAPAAKVARPATAAPAASKRK